MAARPRTTEGSHTAAGSVAALALGAATGVAIARVLTRAGATNVGRSQAKPTVTAADAPTAGPAGFEYLSKIIWSDSPRMGLGDLEDPEGIEDLVDAGWELVHVIVPFAYMKFLEAGGYPGNTRKLIAYFRRPKEACHGIS